MRRNKEITPDGLETGEDREPLENQTRDWADEDIAIENRKPDLGENEEDSSEL